MPSELHGGASDKLIVLGKVSLFIPFHSFGMHRQSQGGYKEGPVTMCENVRHHWIYPNGLLFDHLVTCPDEFYTICGQRQFAIR